MNTETGGLIVGLTNHIPQCVKHTGKCDPTGTLTVSTALQHHMHTVHMHTGWCRMPHIFGERARAVQF